MKEQTSPMVELGDCQLGDSRGETTESCKLFPVVLGVLQVNPHQGVAGARDTPAGCGATPCNPCKWEVGGGTVPLGTLTCTMTETALKPARLIPDTSSPLPQGEKKFSLRVCHPQRVRPARETQLPAICSVPFHSSRETELISLKELSTQHTRTS